MNVCLTEMCANRRKDSRDSLSRSTEYISPNGTRQRTEVINVSLKGARLTTGTEVRVGDHIHIVCPIANGSSTDARAVVRWAKRLPGGLRQVVGVENAKG